MAASVLKTALLPNPAAALPLPEPLDFPLELPPPFDGEAVTLPVPCGPAWAIKELHCPVGEAAACVVAEPLKSQAEARLLPD